MAAYFWTTRNDAFSGLHDDEDLSHDLLGSNTACESAADSHLLKLQFLQNIVPSAPLVTYQGAHRPAIYIERCRFRTFTII